MKNILTVVLVFVCAHFGICQTPVTASVGSAGWKRIAFINSINNTGGRGFGKVTIYTTGGSVTPYQLDVHWAKDWSVKGGITLQTNSTTGYWTAARLTYDSDSAYLEVNFTRDLPAVYILSDTYGWNIAKPFSGSLPNGGGTIRASAKVGKLAIDENFIVSYNGNVGIGTISPASKLEVNGTLRAKEIRVEAGPWPDYVFQKEYELPPLKMIKKYVEENGHLPEVPSANQVEKEGVDLGKMNVILLKKIEELTLHLIEKEDKINSLENRIKTLEVNK